MGERGSSVGCINEGNPWENLANAIIAQAAHDYELSFTKRGQKIVDRDEVTRFFHSDWYQTLTSIDS